MLKPTQSISFKIVLFTLLCIIAVMTGMGIYSYTAQQKRLLTTIDETMVQIADRLENYFPPYVWEPDYERMGTILELEMNNPHIIAIIYRNRLRNYTVGKIKDKNNMISSYDFKMIRNIFKTIPVEIKHHDTILGTATIYLSDKHLKKELTGLVINIIIQLLLITAILFLGVFLFLKKVILNKIYSLDKTVNDFTDKNFNIRAAVKTNDELGHLAQSFNNMAGIIQTYSEKMESKVRERTIELEKVNQYQKKFFENISHEFRTPLTLILGPLESIMQGEYGPTIETTHHLFKSLSYNAARLLQFINSLLDFSRIEADKMKLEKSTINIIKLIRFYLSIAQLSCDSNGISLRFNAHVPFLKTRLDKSLFEKAFFNIVSNAMKFTPRGGEITIEVGHTDEVPFFRSEEQLLANFWYISIRDTGIGIEKSKLPRIFERFNQVHDETYKKHEGTGIGLALTREIIELHGGTITVKSELHKGSLFTLYLPLDTEDQDTNDEPQEINLDFDNRYFIQANTAPEAQNDLIITDIPTHKILLVEDNHEMLNFLTGILENDYHIIQAKNGIDGVNKARLEKPDLIISDVMMPNMDGYEMLVHIREIEELNEVPVILLTAKAETKTRIKMLEHGANDFILKPFNARELKARVKAHLNMKDLRDTIHKQKSELHNKKIALEGLLKENLLHKKELEEREHRFREIVEYLPTIIMEINSDLTLSFLNTRGFDFFKIDYETPIQNITITPFIHPDDQRKFEKNFTDQLAGNYTRVYEYRLVNTENRQSTVLFKSTPLIHNGMCTGLRASILEVQSAMDLITMPGKAFYENYNISQREKDVLLYVIKGFRNKDIGEKLFISEVTVKKHISNILQKTGAKNRKTLLTLIKSRK